MNMEGFETLKDELAHYSVDLDKVLAYLDKLRESGVTNMFGAVPYVRDTFLLPHQEATDSLRYWMRTFSERHPEVT